MGYDPLEFNEQATDEGVLRPLQPSNIAEFGLTSTDFSGGEFTSGLLTDYFSHLEDQKLDSTFPFTWRKFVEDFRDWNHNTNGAPIPTTDPYDLTVFQNLKDTILGPELSQSGVAYDSVGWNFDNEGDFGTTEDQKNLIIDTLIGGILRSYKFNRDNDSLPYSFSDFITYFNDASAITADMFNPESPSIALEVPKDYQKVIETYLPHLTTTEAKQMLMEYIQRQLLVTGTFNPSTFYDRFSSYAESIFEANIDKLRLTDSEIKRREIFSTIFDILLNLYRISQQTILRFQRQLEYLTNLQKEYSRIMAEIPLYKPNPNGYGEYTLDDIKEHAKTFQEVYGAAPMFYLLTAQLGTQEQVREAGSVVFSSDTFENIEDLGIWINLASTASLDQAMYSLSNISAGSATNPLELELKDLLFQPRGRSATGDSNDEGVQLATGDAAVRASKNEQLNQYIESVRGRRSVVKDRASEVENTFNQLNEGLNKITSLMTAIVQQISTILQAIFR